MADLKISQLTAAATPLAGTEVLPIVQSGATVKVSIANVTAGRAISTSSIANGLGAVGTPSYTFTGDTNTGMWSPAADTIAFSEGGVEAMRIDSSARVGIGTSSPNERLTVVGGYADLAGVRIAGASVDALNNIFLNTGELSLSTGSGAIVFKPGTTERVRITGTGNVGLGTGAPSFQLQLSTDSAAKPGTNLWTIASDSRIKTETGGYTKGLDAVCALRPVTYRYNGFAGFEDDGKENISIIAQEAMQHFPECVGTFEVRINESDEEKTELFNWNGHALIFALVNAAKELKAANDALAARVAQLEGK
jgi:hypothetical protein